MVRTFGFDIKGLSPLLMHHDDVMWADTIDHWTKQPLNSKKNGTKAGDDRFPSWKWIGYLYHDGEHICMPSDNLSRCLMSGATMIPTGKGQKTFKGQSQSGMGVVDAFMKLEVNGKHVPMTEIQKLLDEKDFNKHMARTNDFDFYLFIKRATVGTSKHVRVRPRFDSWAFSGSIQVWDDDIKDQHVEDFFSYAGMYVGLGDWRPSSPKVPGRFGRFESTVRRVG